MLPADGFDIPPWSSVADLIGHMPPDPIAEAIGPYLDSAELLGRRTAELHVALSSDGDDAFTPEAFTTLSQRGIYQSMRAQVRPTLQMARQSLPKLDDATREAAERLLASESEIHAVFSSLTKHRFDASRIRVHGDFHLGQVLHAGRDFVIIDFEGEPSKSPTERRIKRCSLADVAGMARSFQYVVAAALRSYQERGLVQPDQHHWLERMGLAWQTWVTIRYLTGYVDTAEGTTFLPSSPADISTLLTAYTLDKALYEVRYELSFRPHWAEIPLNGALQVLEASGGDAGGAS